MKRNRLRFSVLGIGGLDPEQHDTPQGFFALAQECCLLFIAQKAKFSHWLVGLLHRSEWILPFVLLPLPATVEKHTEGSEFPVDRHSVTGRDARLFVLFDQEWMDLAQSLSVLYERPSDCRQYR